MAERPEDLNLPFAVVARLIKESLPPGVQVSKEARSAIARSASVFVLFTASTANSLAKAKKKKTISSSDVLEAMEQIQFDHFIEPLKESLQYFKHTQLEKKAARAKAKKPEGCEEKENANDAVREAEDDPAMEDEKVIEREPEDENVIDEEAHDESSDLELDS